MKKIIFCDVPMQSGLKKMNYATSGGKVYDEGTIYAINSCVAESIKNGDDVKIELLKKMTFRGIPIKISRNSKRNLPILLRERISKQIMLFWKRHLRKPAKFTKNFFVI